MISKIEEEEGEIEVTEGTEVTEEAREVAEKIEDKEEEEVAEDKEMEEMKNLVTCKKGAGETMKRMELGKSMEKKREMKILMMFLRNRKNGLVFD